jgi:hypothetical protein
MDVAESELLAINLPNDFKSKRENGMHLLLQTIVSGE